MGDFGVNKPYACLDDWFVFLSFTECDFLYMCLFSFFRQFSLSLSDPFRRTCIEKSTDYWLNCYGWSLFGSSIGGLELRYLSLSLSRYADTQSLSLFV